MILLKNLKKMNKLQIYLQTKRTTVASTPLSHLKMYQRTLSGAETTVNIKTPF